MSENLNVTIHNVETGQIVVNPMTDEEYALYLADQEETAQMALERETKAAAKAALLEKLGITEEETKLLLS